MSHIPQPREIYRHFKGNLYQVLEMAEHSETGEQLVIYQALYGDYKVYARPLASFMSPVDREKYPEAQQQERFLLMTGIAEPGVRTQQEPAGEETEAEADGSVPDEGLMQFLDAKTYEDKLNVLAGLHHRITDDMITAMAMACDVEVPEGDVEERYKGLQTCLVMMNKFECSRLRR